MQIKSIPCLIISAWKLLCAAAHSVPAFTQALPFSIQTAHPDVKAPLLQCRETEMNEPICCQNDIFKTSLRAGFADICLPGRRAGRAEWEAVLTFCFCLLGMKGMQRLTQRFEKEELNLPFYTLTAKPRFCISWEYGGGILGRKPCLYPQLASGFTLDTNCCRSKICMLCYTRN